MKIFQAIQTSGLREGGIYTLTDRREFVACTSSNGAGFLLYDARTWRGTSTPKYRVHDDGRFSNQGRMTRWTLRQLADTGRTIE